tara:strand:- start:7883 stop:9181 length:1299 start_codon:yes stop_codon:yes gene_type:complete
LHEVALDEHVEIGKTLNMGHPSSRSFDLVIIGGGIIGSAVAYQVARRSNLKVLVVDKADGPATGSTGASVAISRCRYTVPEVVRLAYCSQLAYRSWAEFTGLNDPLSDYTQLGALWIFDRSRSELETEYERLHKNGVAVEMFSRAEVLNRWPELDLCVEPIDFGDLEQHKCRQGDLFLFENEAGIADPAGANADLVASAQQQGVEVVFGSGVTDLVTDRDRVIGVQLDSGDEIHCGLVVNAAGPWCNWINEMAGAQKRWTLTPTRIQLVLREWSGSDPRLPITFDGSTDGCYRIERSGSQILLVSPEIPEFMEPTSDPDFFEVNPDRDCVETTLAAFQHRVPGVKHVGTTTGVCGLYTINEEDSHPVVGPSEIEGLWLANGFSGHGFKLAPGIGAMVARSITGIDAPFDPDIDDDLFAIDRAPLATSGGVFA